MNLELMRQMALGLTPPDPMTGLRTNGPAMTPFAGQGPGPLATPFDTTAGGGAQVPDGNTGPGGFLAEPATQLPSRNPALDALAYALHDNPLQMNPRAKGIDVFLQSLLGSTASGWSNNRLRDMSQTDQLNASLQQQAARRNASNLALSDEQRKAALDESKAIRIAQATAQAKADNAPDKTDPNAIIPVTPEMGKVIHAMVAKGKLLPEQEAYYARVGIPKGKWDALSTATQASGGMFGGDDEPIDGDTLDYLANYLNTTGIMLPQGMKAGGLRTKVYQRAAQLAKGDGGGQGVAANKASFNANSQSLTAMQKMSDAVTAYENTALANSKVMTDAMKRIPDTGSPWLNTPVRLVDERALGSQDLAAFNVARQVVIPEFAKILANPSMSGVLSDEARKEVERVVRGDATFKQMLSVLDVLKTDAHNRRTFYDQQLGTIRGRISGRNGAAGPEASSPASGSRGSVTWTLDANGNPVPAGGR